MAVLAALLLASSVATSARAAPDAAELAEARRAFFEAVAAQDAGHYREALVLYDRVSRVTVSPTLLFNVGTCRENVGELLDAEVAFERALAEASSRGDDEVAAEARAKLGLLRETIPRVAVRVPQDVADATATLDGKPITLAALAELRLDPGSHRLEVRSDRHERVFAVSLELPLRASRVIDVDLGAERTERVRVERITQSVPATRPTWVPAIVAGSAALLFGGGAIGTWAVGDGQRDSYEEMNRAPTSANRSDRERLQSEVEAMSIANAVFVAATVIAVGVGVYFVVRPPATSARHIAVSPTGVRF